MSPSCLRTSMRSAELTTGQARGFGVGRRRGRRLAHRAISRIWPDFHAHRQVDVSSTTIKAQAAQRAFNRLGDGIVWAVVDSGIQKDNSDHVRYCVYSCVLRRISLI